MNMTDPIADLLTRIRNGQSARHKTVKVPASKLKAELVRILMEEGFIDSFKLEPGTPHSAITIELKYDREGTAAITGLNKVSRPGRRVYCGKSDLPSVLGGLGISILSTPLGLLTGNECGRRGVGGEVLCTIW